MVNEAVEKAFNKVILPHLSRRIRAELKTKAEEKSIEIFAKNLRSLLMQKPLTGKTILAIDPGYKNGCKIAIVNSQAQVLQTCTLMPKVTIKVPKLSTFTLSAKEKQKFTSMVQDSKVDFIAIGNGSGSKNCERLISAMIENGDIRNVDYAIVREQGSSIYR